MTCPKTSQILQVHSLCWLRGFAAPVPVQDGAPARGQDGQGPFDTQDGKDPKRSPRAAAFGAAAAQHHPWPLSPGALPARRALPGPALSPCLSGCRLLLLSSSLWPGVSRPAPSALPRGRGAGASSAASPQPPAPRRGERGGGREAPPGPRRRAGKGPGRAAAAGAMAGRAAPGRGQP